MPNRIVPVNASRLSRRTVLRTTSGAALALPWLQAMTPRARAALPELPKRFVVFFPYNGTHASVWRPTTVGPAYALPFALQPLESLRKDFNVLSGLHLRATGNNSHATYCCALSCDKPQLVTGDKQIGGAVSIDQALATKIGMRTKIPSLVVDLNMGRRISWIAAGQPSPIVVGAKKLLAQLFPVPAPMPMSGGSRQRRILDLVRADANRLNARLGPADRRRVDQHLTALDEVDRQLAFAASGAKSCAGLTVPTMTTAMTKAEEMKLTATLIALAFSCDLTRIIVVNLGHVDRVARSATNPTLTDDHEASHMDPEIVGRVTRAKMELFADLLQKLKDTAEGDSNLLKQSLVYTGNDVSDGNKHDVSDMPILLAGGAGGQMRTGNHIRFNDQPVGRLFVSVLNFLGAPTETFGKDGMGALPDLAI